MPTRAQASILKLSRSEMDQSRRSGHRSKPKHGYAEGQRYFYKGFAYNRPLRNEKRGKVYWQCINYGSTKKCNAKFLTNLANVPFDFHITHNHEPTAPGQPNGLETEDSIHKRYEQKYQRGGLAPRLTTVARQNSSTEVQHSGNNDSTLRSAGKGQKRGISMPAVSKSPASIPKRTNPMRQTRMTMYTNQLSSVSGTSNVRGGNGLQAGPSGQSHPRISAGSPQVQFQSTTTPGQQLDLRQARRTISHQSRENAADRNRKNKVSPMVSSGVYTRSSRMLVPEVKTEPNELSEVTGSVSEVPQANVAQDQSEDQTNESTGPDVTVQNEDVSDESTESQEINENNGAHNFETKKENESADSPPQKAIHSVDVLRPIVSAFTQSGQQSLYSAGQPAFTVQAPDGYKYIVGGSFICPKCDKGMRCFNRKGLCTGCCGCCATE